MDGKVSGREGIAHGVTLERAGRTSRETNDLRNPCALRDSMATMESLPARSFLPPERAPMNTLHAPLPAHAGVARGVKCELYHDHCVYFAVTSWGERLPGVRVPIGLESNADVIADLWDDLDRVDPQRLSLVAGDAPAPRPAVACACPPARPFVLLRGF